MVPCCQSSNSAFENKQFPFKLLSLPAAGGIGSAVCCHKSTSSFICHILCCYSNLLIFIFVFIFIFHLHSLYLYCSWYNKHESVVNCCCRMMARLLVCLPKAIFVYKSDRRRVHCRCGVSIQELTKIFFCLNGFSCRSTALR